MLVIEHKVSRLPNAHVASFDLEWTKNYRIKNGNQPFCFSIVFFSSGTQASRLEKEMEFGFVSYYIEDESERTRLVQQAVRLLQQAALTSCTIVGHQLSSDLGVLAAQARGSARKSVGGLRHIWHSRSEQTDGSPRVFDSRYDLLSLTGSSRRLVDVCTEYNMDVRQPELRSSMTALHRQFLQNRDQTIYERLAVLNLRHSLSAGLLYYFGHRGDRPARTLNVNRILYRMLSGRLDYVDSSLFRDLLR